jgi:SAM-dependent methyltransferase
MIAPESGPLAAGTSAAPLADVVWHDLECGGYRADLELWRELSAQAIPTPGSASVLEVGSGTGRVALELARAGHRVTALDIRSELLAALADRAAGLPIETVCADARALELAGREFALCLVPMQTIQLLGGPEARRAFLQGARAALRPGGLLACAIVTDLEPFDCDDGDLGPTAETARVAGRLFESRAIRVRVEPDSIVIERERRIDPGGEHGGAWSELNVIELDRVGASELHREAEQAGLAAAGAYEIPATADHVGSTVVMLRA